MVLGIPNAGIDTVNNLHDQEGKKTHGEEEHDAAEEEPRYDVARSVHGYGGHQAQQQMLAVQALQVPGHAPGPGRHCSPPLEFGGVGLLPKHSSVHAQIHRHL